MPTAPQATVRVDLDTIRSNAETIRRDAGVDVLAIVKADAYGCGAAEVARAIADVVAEFVVFNTAEAVDAGLKELNKPILALGPPHSEDPNFYINQGIHPAVWTAAQAAALRRARPVLSVDTGMQRFACPRESVDEAITAGDCNEAFTHATSLPQAQLLEEVVGGRGLRLHAAGSSLLHEPTARFDAVRPGLALYRGAVRVSAPLIDARDGRGPAGYTGFVAPRHGVILGGYALGLRPGPCLVNGQPRRVLETGMQSSFVEIGPDDGIGDEVVLLGDGLTEDEVASAWGTSPHEVLVRLTKL